MDEQLVQIGDELESAVAMTIARNNSTGEGHEADMEPTMHSPVRTSRRRRRIVIGAALGAVALAGVGTAAAVSLLSADEVARGLPGGSLIFEGTNPSCTSTDDVVFTCMLASAPTFEVVDDYTGSAQLFVDDEGNIAGGCRGQDVAGLHWTCYAGQRAVDEQILVADLLGQHLDGPTVG